MLPGGTHIFCRPSEYFFPELDLYYADLALPLTAAREEPDDLDRDLSVVDLSVRGVHEL